MIPLIDVSLVLLIFFMLTSTAAVGVAAINTPPAIHGNIVGKNAMVWVNIDLPRDEAGKVIRGGNPIYSVSYGEAPAADADSNLHTITAAMDRLKLRLDGLQGPPEVTIRPRHGRPLRRRPRRHRRADPAGSEGAEEVHRRQ